MEPVIYAGPMPEVVRIRRPRQAATAFVCTSCHLVVLFDLVAMERTLAAADFRGRVWETHHGSTACSDGNL